MTAHGMMEFKVGSTITMGQLPESQCTVNCGGCAGGTVVIENDSEYKDWKVLDSLLGQTAAVRITPEPICRLSHSASSEQFTL